MTNDGTEYPASRFEEALGTYVGPATQDEVLQAIVDHDGAGAELAIQLTAPDGELVWHRTGHLAEHIEGEHQVVLVVAGPEAMAGGNPLIYTEVQMVLSFSRDERQAARFDADRYSGGVRLRLGFNQLMDHTLTVVLWHSIKHFTESGDVAPGFGLFEVDMIRKDHV